MLRLWILILFCLVALPGFSYGQWSRGATQPPYLSELVSIQSAQPGQVWVASEESIYKQENHGWKTLWTHTHHRGLIRQILFFKNLPHHLFVLTDEGLYVGHQLTGTWTRVFYGTNDFENNILSFAVHPKESHFWLLGTHAGLFQSLDAGKTWKFIWQLKKDPISIIGFSETSILLANHKAIYKTKNLIEFQKTLTLPSVDHTDELETTSQDEEETLHFGTLPFKDLVIQSPYLWLATHQGLYESKDEGSSWKKLTTAGLKNTEIQDVLWFEERATLLVSTPTSLYRYQPHNQSWEPFYASIPHEGFRELSFKPSNQSLVALSEFALYELPIVDILISPEKISFDPSRRPLLEKLFKLEPRMLEIQNQVIAYNDTDNKKIKSWHALSRLKHLLPDFSFGRDFSRSNNIDLDRGSTSVSDIYISGPDDFSQGWDMSVSWDLGDLIWTSSQTSIDIRSKSMVELRQDLLGEATRLYYERRRVQVQLALNPSLAMEDFFEKSIRLDELTALLDSLTGGWFTHKLESINLEYPELQELWQPKSIKELEASDW